jgi:uncharacterized Fe-S cluster-containing protein
MNPNETNNDYENDNVRPPDPVIKERLVDYGDNDNDDFANYNYNYNYLETNNNDDIDRILKESLEEFELAEEQKIQEMLAIERSEKAKKYTSIKERLQKIQSYDISNKDTYGTIISIIELYEADFIESYFLDETSYNNIFKLLRTIRLTKEDLDLLGSLIVL